MDAPERGALMLVRFIAAGLIGWAVVDVSLYLAICSHKDLPVEILPCLLKSIFAVAGILILVRARSIAGWVAELFD
jgi:hypothetical protein